MADETTRAQGETGTIAFVGTGTMGAPMAAQLLAAGYRLSVHDAVPAATATLVEAGATSHATAADAAAGADVVLLSLPGPPQVRAAITGPGGVLEASRPPPLIIDLSTNSVEAVADLRAACEEAGVVFVDAPVSGGVARAREGTLAVMVGAAPAEFDTARPVLEVIGSDVIHVGPPGTGTIAKIVNNQLFLAAGVLVQEAYVLGAALGMSPTDLHRVIAASSGGPYAKLAPLLMGRRFDDVIFRLDIAAKDVGLAVDTAAVAGVDAPLTRAAGEIYEAAIAAGDGELVFHATLRELERRALIELEPLRRPPRGESDRGRS
jgi:3-hydroxyisobutyrate dehydrogenase-like beta-hydroxyacid dehydrogenase